MTERTAPKAPVVGPPAGHPPLWAVVELLDIQLVELRATTNWRSDALPESAPLLNMTTHTTSELVPDSSRLSATIRFYLHSQHENSARPEDSDFFLAATYRVLYEFPADYHVGDAQRKDFENRNVPFNVYAYWRELVHSTCTRMELPVGHLPLFRVRPPTRLGADDAKTADPPAKTPSRRRNVSRETIRRNKGS